MRSIRARLEGGTLAPDTALEPLANLAHDAAFRAARIEAYRVIGDIAGRAFQASAETADRAAWILLEVALDADDALDRGALLIAMGRGFQNVWLMPFVHRRLSDRDPAIVSAALSAAGGLALPPLEEAVAEFLATESSASLRIDAIAALGRMGALSVVDPLIALVEAESNVSAAALTALTEIRAAAGADAAVSMLERFPDRRVLLAGMRYLAEIGRPEVLPTLRRLAREEDPELRLAAGLASRALKAERSQDAGERILIALAEPDRAVRAALARRLRTVAVEEVLMHASALLDDDAEGVVQVLGELRDPRTTRFLLDRAADPDLPMSVRSGALASVHAETQDVRDALARLALAPGPEPIRLAATRALGSSGSLEDLLQHAGALAHDPSPALRGAFLWTLQLVVPPGRLTPASRTRARPSCDAHFAIPTQACAGAPPTVRAISTSGAWLRISSRSRAPRPSDPICGWPPSWD